MQKFYMTCKCSLVLLLVFLANAAFAQITVTGTVTDDVGALPNVSVTIVGKSSGTQTGPNGKYSIAADKGAVLKFSAVGFKSKQVTVGDNAVINVQLAEDNGQLSEVVVTAFGIKREAKALGYSASTVSAKELTEAGNTNFASALYGKAAGVKLNTSPGGASSAVNVQIRGLNSVNYNAQPLYVVDGVILRNTGQGGAGGLNNGGFYDDQRIRGNGILDVNPEDIESLTVLKGASATALYGSDAIAGVIVITTKKGVKGKGLGIDFNYYGTLENAAFLPDYQNVYGQGYDRATNLSVGAQEDGTFVDAASPAGWRPNFRAYYQFGPKMEGQQVRWWDGSIRSYSPQPDNYKDIFRTGYSSLANVSISKQTDDLNYRISASRLDYNGIQRESNQKKNTFSLNSTLKLSPKLSVDLVANYVNTITHNRPYLTNRLAASFDGFFGRNEDVNLILDKFQTTQGYKWVPFNQTARNPEEAFIFNVRPNLYDYFWTTQVNTYDENENRLYTSATANWEVVKNLKLRGRVGNDYTGKNVEDRQFNEYPTAFNGGTSTGAYTVQKGIYSIVYADALLTYSNNLSKDLEFSASAGFTTRSERYNDQSSGTSNGLVLENFFSLNNSTGIINASSTRQELTKYGTFGVLNFNYKNFLFLEGTARQESASTLPPENNSYFYPSVNAGFVFTDAFKSSVPSFLSFGKLRASYGVVGSPASLYQSNILYALRSLQTPTGSVPQATLGSSNYGNNFLMPEKKYEKEFGLETRMFNDRFGFDFTYYDNRIKNIILNLPVASSVGANTQIVNIGEIGNKGYELAMNGSPLVGRFKWQTRVNVALNTSKAYSLGQNIDEIRMYTAEGNAIKVLVSPNEKMGNIYVNPLKTDANGNNVISSDGFHIIDNTRYVKAGNVQAGVTGGFSNSFSYDNFSLNVLVDYRFGGQLVSSPQKYQLGAGMFKSTLKYRDSENGGLTYYINPSGEYVQIPVTQTAGPGGEKVYHDGLILPGVLENGQPNTKIIDAASYYPTEFDASGNANNMDGAIYDNSFVKLREVVLGYRLPSKVASKIGMSNLRISLIGRNLLYFWKTLKNLDPETVIGSQWYKQGVDEGSLPATRSYGFSINASF